MGRRVDGQSYWTPAFIADWLEANNVGHVRAEELIAEMRNTENPLILGRTAKAIFDSGHFSGVEVGFYYRLAIELLK